MTTTPEIRPMALSDYDAVFRVWSQTEGMCLGEDDNREGIARYLARNPGLCFVAVSDAGLIGTVLCGHDGRRGILRHLAIAPEFRRQGLAQALVELCLAALAQQGIAKCNVFVMDDNAAGLRFWEHLGFRALDDDYRTLQGDVARVSRPHSYTQVARSEMARRIDAPTGQPRP